MIAVTRLLRWDTASSPDQRSLNMCCTATPKPALKSFPFDFVHTYWGSDTKTKKLLGFSCASAVTERKSAEAMAETMASLRMRFLLRPLVARLSPVSMICDTDRVTSNGRGDGRLAFPSIRRQSHQDFFAGGGGVDLRDGAAALI